MLGQMERREAPGGNGYSGVHWFPGGVGGWQEKHETFLVQADEDWSAATAR